MHLPVSENLERSIQRDKALMVMLTLELMYPDAKLQIPDLSSLVDEKSHRK